MLHIGQILHFLQLLPFVSFQTPLKPIPMHNIRILICTIFALLVGMLVYFYVSPNPTGLTDEPSIEDLEREYIDAQLRNDENSYDFLPTIAPPAPVEPAPLTKEEMLAEQMRQEEALAIQEAEIQKLADEAEAKIMAEQKAAQMAAEEAQLAAEELANRPPPVSEDRLQLISSALTMATVLEYNSQYKIAMLSISHPNVAVGEILGIRRKDSGIIGRLKVASIDNKGLASADAIPESFFGQPVSVNVGDELIIIP